MKDRRHHNNDARTQIKRGKTRDQVRAIAERLGIPFSTGRVVPHQAENRGATGGAEPTGQGSEARADEKSARTQERG